MEDDEKPSRSKAVRKDGRRPLLVYLPPDLIRDVKKAAVDCDRHVYEIAEDAIAAWLAQEQAANTGN